MDKIHYAGDTVITGSAIARALLDYAHALAQKGDSATVDIPVYFADGSRGRSEFLIGPASQLVSDETQDDREELIDTETVERLQAATRALGGTRVLPADYSATSAVDLEFPNFGEL